MIKMDKINRMKKEILKNLFKISRLYQTINPMKTRTSWLMKQKRKKVKEIRKVWKNKAVIEKPIRNLNIFIPNQICTKFKSNRGKSERFLAQFPKLYLWRNLSINFFYLLISQKALTKSSHSKEMSQKCMHSSNYRLSLF